MCLLSIKLVTSYVHVLIHRVYNYIFPVSLPLALSLSSISKLSPSPFPHATFLYLHPVYNPISKLSPSPFPSLPSRSIGVSLSTRHRQRTTTRQKLLQVTYTMVCLL